MVPNKKEEIFNEAIALIARDGFESISMRAIAAAAKIKSASIYYHYENKQQILWDIYDYYLVHYNESRLPDNEIFRLVRTGTQDEIVEAFTKASFIWLDNPIVSRMMLITKIIYSRIYCDARAAEIFQSTTQDTRLYLKRAVDYGMEIERLKPFDSDGFAYAFVALYMNMGVMAFINPDYQPEHEECGVKICRWMKQMLGFVDSENKQAAL